MADKVIGLDVGTSAVRAVSLSRGTPSRPPGESWAGSVLADRRRSNEIRVDQRRPRARRCVDLHGTSQPIKRGERT